MAVIDKINNLVPCMTCANIELTNQEMYNMIYQIGCTDKNIKTLEDIFDFFMIYNSIIETGLVCTNTINVLQDTLNKANEICKSFKVTQCCY